MKEIMFTNKEIRVLLKVLEDIDEGYWLDKVPTSGSYDEMLEIMDHQRTLKKLTIKIKSK